MVIYFGIVKYMERTTIKQADKPPKKEPTPEQAASHQEAVEFVAQNRDLFEHYARGKLKIEPAPTGLDTFAFDLEKDTIYVNSRFYKNLGLSDQKTAFATLHEIEHFTEKVKLLGEKNGRRVFESYLGKIKGSKAYDLMDNCVADIRENKAVVARTNEGFAQLERSLYTEDLFKETDFTAAPKHIQLPQALLRESRVPDEPCQVAPEVRAKLDEIQAITAKDGTRLVDVITHPDTPMSVRLKLQDRFIWPAVQELMKKDVEDKKDKKPKQGKENEKGKPSPDESGNPDEIFKEAYQEAAKKVPNAVPIEKVEAEFKKWKESQKTSPLERADREYADKLGVKTEDLKRYRAIVESLKKVVDPETGESVIEELRNLIARIIAKRLKPTPAPRYPVEEGEELVDPSGLVSDVKAGNLEPKVWETTETKEHPGKKFGEVEITLICDRSSSMTQGSKLREQLKAAVLMMEVLKEFADQCEEEQINLTKPLEIRSEIYSFQSSSADAVPLKRMSRELGEKERIDVAGMLASAPGSTTDFVPLETIEQGLPEDTRHKIAEGELKKIVIVFTDGGSDDASRVQAVLEKLRQAGVATIGVGMTEDGRPALETYAPDARLAIQAEDLTKALADLLKEHLTDI
jgi:hypothetical protein